VSLSTFDVFKIGIGPSSSHTMGPMRAAREFATRLKSAGLLERTHEVVIRLYGSLALTGSGHGTDRAVLLGLMGEEPQTVDPDSMEPALQKVRSSGELVLLGQHPIRFDEPMQLLFMRAERLPRHTNGMRFSALDAAGARLCDEDYYSLGGGFIVRGDDLESEVAAAGHLAGHAGLRGARFSSDRGAARSAQGTAAGAENAPHAHRRQRATGRAGGHGLGECLGTGGQ
jgi:L-serine dehydratase